MKKNSDIKFIFFVAALIYFCFLPEVLAINEFRQDTHIINQDLMLGNGANLITLTENSGSLTIDSQVIFSDQIQISGGTPAVDRVLRSDANGLASWVDASTLPGIGSEWTDTGTIVHPSEPTVDEVVIGGTSEAGADIFLGVDGTAVFNEQSNSVDFRVETNGDENALVVDGSANNVGVGFAAPNSKLAVNGVGLFAGNVNPSLDNGFDLGTNSLRWKDLFLGPNSLHIGSSANEAVIRYDTSNNELEFDPDDDGFAELIVTDGGAVTATTSFTAPTVTATTTLQAATFDSSSDGTTANTAYGFTSDSNTGMRRAGIDDLRLVAGGNDLLQLAGSTVTALQNFDVDGTTTFGSLQQASITSTGLFRAPNGSEAAPGFAFLGDINTGMRRAAVDDLRLVAGGNDLVQLAASTATVLQNLDIDGTTTFGSSQQASITSTGLFRAPDGSEAAPGFAFLGDINTGMRRPGVDDLRLVAGGNDLLQLTGSTATALENFDVNGTSTFGSAAQFEITSLGVLRAPDGTAVAPAIAFKSDTNTGFYRSGVDELSMSVAGSQKMFVNDSSFNILDAQFIFDTDTFVINNSSDNVGIGLTNPQAKLHLQNSSGGIVPQVEVEQLGAGDSAMQFTIVGDSYAFGIDNTDDTLKFSYSSLTGGARLGTNDRMVIDSAGNVGIGVSDPDARLEINGQIKITGGTPAAGEVLTTDANGLATWEPVAVSSSEWTDTGTIIHPVEPTVDEVAIGGTSEAGADIFLGVDGTAVFNEQSNSVDFRVESNSDENALVVDGSANNVGIGFASPGAKLAVNGQLLLVDGTIAYDTINSEFDFDSQVNVASGGIVVPVGSVGAPSITFTGDTDTGLYRGATADRLFVSTAGVERLAITANETTFNQGGADTDFRIEGDTQPFLFFVNAGTDTVSTAGQIQSINGSNTVPSYSFSSDSDTGMYHDAGSDVLRFATGGVERLVLSNTEVAFNQTGADTDFRIEGDTQPFLFFVNAGTDTVSTAGQIQSINGSNTVPSYSFTSDTDTGMYHDAGSDVLRFATGGIERLVLSNTEVAFNQTGADTNFRIEGDTDTNVLVVDASADNVGIGVVDPDAKLEINGQIKITGGSPAANRVLTSDINGLATWTEIASIPGSGGEWTDTGTIVHPNEPTVDEVAIGGTTEAGSDIFLGVDGTTVFNQQGNDADFRIEGDTIANMFFVDASTNRVAVGINDPAVAFVVESDLLVNDPDETAAEIRSGGSQLRLLDTGDNDYVEIGHHGFGVSFVLNDANSNEGGNGTEREVMFLHNSTNVGVGTDDPSAKLEINGQVLITGGSPAVDRVLRSNASGLATWVDVSSLPGVGGEWTDTGTIIHPAEPTVDEVAIGGTTEAGSDIFLGVDGTSVFNEQGNSVDFRVEGNTEPNLLFVDGSADNVGIGTNTPAQLLHIDGGLVRVSDSNAFVANMQWDATGLTGGRMYSINSTGGTASQGQGKFVIRDATGSLDRLTINSAGNVGIGTTNPSANLHIADAADATFTIAADTNNSGGEDQNPRLNLIQDGGAVSAFMQLEGLDAATVTSSLANSLLVGTSGAVPAQFFTNDAVRMTIRGTGNIGIGTNNPDDLLELAGDLGGEGIHIDSSSGAGIRIDRGAVSNAGGVQLQTAGSDEWFVGMRTDTDSRFRIKEGDFDGTTHFTIMPSSGNVGIGETSPTSNLHISSLTDVSIRLEADTNDIGEDQNPSIDFSQDGGNTNAYMKLEGAAGDTVAGTIANAILIGSPQNIPLQIIGDDALNLTLEGTGNLGLGVNDPDAKLEINGQIKITGGSPVAGEVLTTDANGLATWEPAAAGAEWTDTGTIVHPSEPTVDEVAIGGTSEAGADIFLGVDGNAVFNEQGNSSDFRVESNTDTVAFVVDGSTDNVGVGFATPGAKLAVNGGSLFAGNIVPTVDNGFDLGTNLVRWKDLFLGPNSLHIGSSANEAVISYDTANNQLEFDPDDDGTAELIVTDVGALTATTSITAPTITATTSFNAASFRATNDGTAGTPAYGFTSDANIGMRRVAEDTIGLSTGGVDRFTISNAAVNVVNAFTTQSTTTLGDDLLTDFEIYAGDGSAPSPSLSFRNAQNLGLFNIGSNTMGFSAGGAERMRLSNTSFEIDVPVTVDNSFVVNNSFTSNGVILTGIDGTAGAPAYSFESETSMGMRRTGSSTIGFSTGGVDRLTVSNTAVNVINALTTQSTTTLGGDLFSDFEIYSGDGSASSPSLSFNNAQNLGLFNAGSNTMGFSAGGAQRMAMSNTSFDIDIPVVVDNTLTVNQDFVPNGVVLIGVDGTAGAPAYSFENETSMGMRRTSSSTIGFSTGGVDRFTISNAAVNVINAFTTQSTTTLGDDLLTDFEIYAGDGSAPSPSLSFNNAQNLGLFNIGSNTMGFSAGGAERMRMSNTAFTVNLPTNITGNVGVDFASPAAELAVNGQVLISGGSPGVDKVLRSNAVGLATWVEVSSLPGISGEWTDTGTIVHPNEPTVDEVVIGGTTELTADIFLGVDGDTVFNQQSNSVNFRIESNNDTDAFVVNGTSDNVGIGTSTPGAKLEVDGDSLFDGDVLPVVHNTYDLGSDSVRWRDLFLGPNSLHIGNDTEEAQITYNTAADRLEFDPDGDTVSEFSIHANGQVLIASGAVDDLSLAFIGDENTGFFRNGADSWRFVTGGGERMTISNTGVNIDTLTVDSNLSFTGPLTIGDGSAATPAYSFTGDSDTGIYRSAVNTINFSTGGSERMLITGSIVRVPASSTLDVLGTLSHAGPYLAAGASASNPAFSFTGDPDTGVFSAAANTLSFSTGGTERMLVTGSIVRIPASSTLDVLGTLSFAGPFGIGSGGTAAAPAYTFSGDTDVGVFRVGVNTLGLAAGGEEKVRMDGLGVVFNELSADENFRVETNNNANTFSIDGALDTVGFGTAQGSTNVHILETNTNTTPMFKMEQDSTGDASLEFNISGDAYAVGIDNSDLDKFKISYGTANPVLGTSDRFVIDVNGNVGVGVSDPDTDLEINGQIKITGGTPGAGQVLTTDANGLATWEDPAVGVTEWTDTGTIIHPTEPTVDEVAIGGTSEAGADIFLGVDGTAVFNEQSNSVNFRVESNNDANALVVEGSSDNVGIGVLTPQAKLHIDTSNTSTTPLVEVEQLSTGDSAMQFSISGDAYALGVDNSDSDKFKISYAAGAGTGVLGTNDRLVIDSAGNVAINNSSPQALLDLEDTNNSEFIRLANSTGVDSVGIFSGSNSPEGLVTAQLGSIYLSSTGTFFVKNTGDNTSTGWLAPAVGALTEIVQDTTPQLGGNLDVNGNEITSAGNGDVTINPAGTGIISIGSSMVPDTTNTYDLGTNTQRFGETFWGPTSSAILHIGTSTTDEMTMRYLTSSNQFVLNEDGLTVDTRIEGDNDANLIFVDASADNVGIGLSGPTQKLDVSGSVRASSNIISGAGTAALPSHTFSTDTDTGIYRASTNSLGFSTAGVQRGNFTSSGVLNLLNGVNITGGTSSMTQTSFTGQILASAGTAAAPGYAFSSDSDTGVYRTSTNSLGFATAGTQRGNFTSSGVLNLLNGVNITGGTNSMTATTFTGTATLKNGSVSDLSLSFVSDDDIGLYRAGTNALGIATVDIERARFNTIEFVVNEPGNDYNFRAEGDTESDLFVVDAGLDNVGIGILLPQAQLHVQESNASTLPIVEIEQTSTGDSALQFSVNNDSYAVGIDNSDLDKFKISYFANEGGALLGTNDRFVIDVAGNVGVGNTSPSAIFDIGETNNSEFMRLSNSDNADSAGIFSGFNNPEGLVDAQLGSIYLNTSDGTFYIKDSGDGTDTGWLAAVAGPITEGQWTDTGSILHPNEETVDEIAIGGSSEASADIFLGVDGAAVFNEQGNSSDLRVETSGDENTLVVDGSADNVGIGFAAPTAKLAVNGGALFAGNVNPSIDNGFDLGTSSLRWRDLFLGPNSLHIGNDSNEAVIRYDTNNNELIFDADGDGDSEFTVSDSGNVDLIGSSFRLPRNTSDPSGLEGMMHYDTDDDRFRVNVGGTWETITTDESIFEMARYSEQYASDTSLPSTVTTYITRNINTTDFDNSPNISRSGSDITLNAGTYRIQAAAPAYRVNGHRMRIRTTGGTTLLTGTTEHSGQDNGRVMSWSRVDSIVTLASQTTIRVEHRCANTKALDGYGRAAGFVGENEIYTHIVIEKLL